MNRPLAAVEPDELFQHTRWMRTMARSLLGDETLAEDVVQDTWATALQRAPGEPGMLRRWLRGAVRNVSRQRRRTETRLRRREERGARAEATEVTAEALLARAELHRRVAEGVLALEEPYRSTVLLRFYEELAPPAIAQRQGVPVQTVRTRLRRALEKLRDHLDRDYGERRRWGAILIPWVGIPPTLATVPDSVITASGAATAPGAAIPWTLLFVCVVASSTAVGFWLGASREPTTAPSVALETLRSENRRLRDELHSAGTARDEARRSKTQLETRVTELERALAERQAAAPTVAPSPTHLLRFGEVGHLEVLDRIDWQDMAEAIELTHRLLTDVFEQERRGIPPPEDLREQLVEQNNRLLRSLVLVVGLLPSNARLNGEMTHPIMLANLLSALLDLNGHPLTVPQRRSIIAHGERYEVEYHTRQDDYDEETLLLERIVDELELKHATVTAMHDELTELQRTLVSPPELRGRGQLDVLSPVNMITFEVSPLLRDSRVELIGSLPAIFASTYGLPVAELESRPELFEKHVASLASSIEEVPTTRAAFYRIDHALHSGRVTIDTLKSLIAELEIDATTREAVLHARTWVVPRLRAPGS